MKNFPRRLISEAEQIRILLQEYRVLYGLLQWRLAAADRRILVVGGLLAGVMTAIRTLDVDSARLLLWGLPVALWVIVSVAVGHARSKEDLLRRIDEIEHHINRLADSELLAFQSRHPHRGRSVGGRTSATAINGILALCIGILAICCRLYQIRVGESADYMTAYLVHAGLWAVLMLRTATVLQRYRYERPTLVMPDDPPE